MLGFIIRYSKRMVIDNFLITGYWVMTFFDWSGSLNWSKKENCHDITPFRIEDDTLHLLRTTKNYISILNIFDESWPCTDHFLKMGKERGKKEMVDWMNGFVDQKGKVVQTSEQHFRTLSSTTPLAIGSSFWLLKNKKWKWRRRRS